MCLFKDALGQPIDVKIIAAQDLLLQREALTLQTTADRFQRAQQLRQIRCTLWLKMLAEIGYPSTPAYRVRAYPPAEQAHAAPAHTIPAADIPQLTRRKCAHQLPFVASTPGLCNRVTIVHSKDGILPFALGMSSCLALSSSGKGRAERPSRKILSLHQQHAPDTWQSNSVIAKIECSIFAASRV